MAAENLDDPPAASAANDFTQKSSTGKKVQYGPNWKIALNWCQILGISVPCVSDFAFVPTTDDLVGEEHGATKASEEQLEEPAVKKQRTEG